MKTIFIFRVAIFLSLVFVIQANAQTQITTADELASINNDVTSLRGRYILMNDLTVENWTPIGDANQPFLGIFDGDGHTITVISLGEVSFAPFKMRSGEKIPTLETSYIGVFGFNGRRSIIKNLRVEGEIKYESVKTGNLIVGGITGANYGSILNCVSGASITAIHSKEGGLNEGSFFAGGIIGVNNGVNRNCYSSGMVIAEGGTTNYAGGITGLNDFDAGIIQWCYAIGDVSAKNGNMSYTGGVAGLNVRGGLVQYCVAMNGSISSDESENAFTGRFSGKNLGSAGNNFSSNDISLSKDDSKPNDRTIYELSSLQSTEWWTVNRHIRFAFGSDDTRPWAWNDDARRPVLHWESGADLEPVTARNRRVAASSSSQNVTEIRSAEEMRLVGADLVNLRKNYILMNDITVENWTPIGYDKGSFTGSFDGNGYTVTITSVISDTAQTRNMHRTLNIGLFSINNGLIKNLRVTGDIKCNSGTKTLYMGGIAGTNERTIMNCVSEINISADGGLESGRRSAGNLLLGAAVGGISKVASIAIFQQGAYAGCIAGLNHGNIKNCYATGDISVTGNGNKSGGGIAGGNGVDWCRITNCYATGNISAKEDNGARFAGGITGYNVLAHVENCVSLNESLTAIGKAGGVTLSITGFLAANNINYTVGVNAGDGNRNGIISYSYYRGDMKITKEKGEKEEEIKEEPEPEIQPGEDEGNWFKRTNKGRRINYEVTQNKEWWTGTSKKFEYLFGTEEETPWVWDEGLKRPVLYWEADDFEHKSSISEELEEE